MVSQMMINACTAEKEIPLNTCLLTVYVLRLLRRKLYSGLIRKIRVMQISPTPVEILFGINSHEKSITRKSNYTSLLMRHYIYSSKLNNKVIAFEEFIDKLLMNYNHEDFC